MKLFRRNSILIKSSFNWFKIKLCPIKLEKKKIAWSSSSWTLSSIPIATFWLSYSGILNGTRALWTRVPCNFFFFFKFDQAKPIATFWLSYSIVLNWTRVLRNFFFFSSLIVQYSIFYKSSFSLKLDFEKIEFQNRDTDLNSFKTRTYC